MKEQMKDVKETIAHFVEVYNFAIIPELEIIENETFSIFGDSDEYTLCKKNIEITKKMMNVVTNKLSRKIEDIARYDNENYNDNENDDLMENYMAD